MKIATLSSAAERVKRIPQRLLAASRDHALQEQLGTTLVPEHAGETRLQQAVVAGDSARSGGSGIEGARARSSRSVSRLTDTGVIGRCAPWRRGYGSKPCSFTAPSSPAFSLQYLCLNGSLSRVHLHLSVVGAECDTCILINVQPILPERVKRIPQRLLAASRDHALQEQLGTTLVPEHAGETRLQQAVVAGDSARSGGSGIEGGARARSSSSVSRLTDAGVIGRCAPWRR